MLGSLSLNVYYKRLLNSERAERCQNMPLLKRLFSTLYLDTCNTSNTTLSNQFVHLLCDYGVFICVTTANLTEVHRG